jgi:hypothetical protein
VLVLDMIEIFPPLGKYKYDTCKYSQRNATLTILCACGAAYKTSTYYTVLHAGVVRPSLCDKRALSLLRSEANSSIRRDSVPKYPGGSRSLNVWSGELRLNVVWPWH